MTASGIPAGDALLIEVARAAAAADGARSDMVARLGGDEFALIQLDTDQPNGATALAERVIKTISAPYLVEGHQIIIGASVGIAIAPADGSDEDELLKNADMALYRCQGRRARSLPILRARDGCENAGAARA